MFELETKRLHGVGADCEALRFGASGGGHVTHVTSAMIHCSLVVIIFYIETFSSNYLKRKKRKDRHVCGVNIQ